MIWSKCHQSAMTQNNNKISLTKRNRIAKALVKKTSMEKSLTSRKERRKLESPDKKEQENELSKHDKFTVRSIEFPWINYNDSEIRIVDHMMLQLRDIWNGISWQYFVIYRHKKGLKILLWREEETPKVIWKIIWWSIFSPVSYDSLSETECKRALESLFFLTEKKDGRVIARYLAIGKPRWLWLDRDEVSSPTEATMPTGVIASLEGQDFATCRILLWANNTTQPDYQTLAPQPTSIARARLH